MSNYNDAFDFYGVPVYIEFSIDGEGVFTAELIEIGGVDILEHLKEYYVLELTNEACDRMNEK